MAEGFLPGIPSVVDCHSDIVDGLAFLPFGNEREEKVDETLLHDEGLVDGRFLLAHGGNDLGEVSCRLAVAEEGDVATEGFHLIYMARACSASVSSSSCISEEESFFSANSRPKKFCSAFVALGRIWLLPPYMLMFTSDICSSLDFIQQIFNIFQRLSTELFSAPRCCNFASAKTKNEG